MPQLPFELDLSTIAHAEGSWLAGRYQVIEKLGQGGMGAVYLAHDHNLHGRPVVIKAPHLKALGTVEAQYFAREIESLSRLAIAGVVPIIDQGVVHLDLGIAGTVDLPWYALQKMDGGTLADRFPQTLEQAVVWLRDVAEVLDEIHGNSDSSTGQPMLHRDIKPENLFFDGRGRVMVGDFGLARALPAADATLTQSLSEGGFRGSPRYVAPEVCQEGARLGPAYDQYALACTLWTALATPAAPAPEAGQNAERDANREVNPFEYAPPKDRDVAASYPWRYVQAKSEGRPRQLSEVGVERLDNLDEVFARALHPDPAKRYATCCELYEAVVACRMESRAHSGSGLETGLEDASRTARKVVVVEEASRSAAVTRAERRAEALPNGTDPRLVEGLVLQGRNPASGLLEYLHEQTGVVLVLLPGGAFEMGSPDGEGLPWEQPQHEVSVSPFLLAKVPLTQEQWSRLAVRRDLRIPGWSHEGARHPATNVSWHDCEEWLAEAAPRLGLPTEAQWEYACRAGSSSRYCFGECEEGLRDFGWSLENSAGTSREVGHLRPNVWGLYDMHGGVWEWCQDLWHHDYQQASRDGAAWLANGVEGCRVARGGAWDLPAIHNRSAMRAGEPEDGRRVILGVRPARHLF